MTAVLCTSNMLHDRRFEHAVDILVRRYRLRVRHFSHGHRLVFLPRQWRALQPLHYVRLFLGSAAEGKLVPI